MLLTLFVPWIYDNDWSNLDMFWMSGIFSDYIWKDNQGENSIRIILILMYILGLRTSSMYIIYLHHTSTHHLNIGTLFVAILELHGINKLCGQAIEAMQMYYSKSRPILTNVLILLLNTELLLKVCPINNWSTSVKRLFQPTIIERLAIVMIYNCIGLFMA